AGAHVERQPGDRDVRRRDEMVDRQLEKEVDHRGVAHQAQIRDLAPALARAGSERSDQLVKRPARNLGQGASAGAVLARRDQPADQILAVAELWVRSARSRELLAGLEVDEVARDLGGPEIEGCAEGALALALEADDLRAAHEGREPPAPFAGDARKLVP